MVIIEKTPNKQVMTVLRNLLYHHVFNTSAVKTVQLEHTKPIVAPAGSDSFGGIGKPPIPPPVHWGRQR